MTETKPPLKLFEVAANPDPDSTLPLGVRYPTVLIHFAETRPLAEEWTYRFLGAALAYAQAESSSRARP
jgi:hypothetical protein